MSYSTIKKSELEGAHRLDAEYYQPAYLEVEGKISSFSFQTIKDISNRVFSGPFGSTLKSESYQTSGVPFIRIADITDIFIDKNTLVYISPSEHKRIYSTRLNSGDIVFSKIGTVGRLSVISKEFSEVNISENNIGIRLSKLSPEMRAYLLFFLLSKYGQSQILRRASGNIQLKLNVSDIENIKVPILKSFLFFHLYEQILDFKERSESVYSQAENLLLEELGLKDFQVDEELWSIINFSDMENAGRMDAEYFQAKYKKLISKLEEQKAIKLEGALEDVPAKFNPFTQSNKPFNYVELSNINASIGIIDGTSEVLGKEAPSRAKRVLKAGDVIVSSVEGSLEKVALVDKEQEGYLASTGFFQFRSTKFLPEVILVLAKSFIFHSQLEQRCAGTILTAVPKESIKDILIPIVPKQVQQKIAELVRQSHEARRKAHELLEEAKHKVEEMIERQSMQYGF